MLKFMLVVSLCTSVAVTSVTFWSMTNETIRTEEEADTKMVDVRLKSALKAEGDEVIMGAPRPAEARGKRNKESKIVFSSSFCLARNRRRQMEAEDRVRWHLIQLSYPPFNSTTNQECFFKTQ